MASNWELIMLTVTISNVKNQCNDKDYSHHEQKRIFISTKIQKYHEIIVILDIQWHASIEWHN